jgi:hypothetical protein
VREPNKNLKGKSFAWGFVLYIVLFSCSAMWGEKVGVSKNFSLVLLVLSGYVPFLVQLYIGYTFDGMWVARYSRTENPVMYWALIFVSVLLGLFFTFIAYNMYSTGNRPVT